MAVNIVTGMTGIEHITSHDDRARNASQFGRGKYVFDIGRKFSATAVDDNLVRIQDGMCINQGTQMGIEPNDYTDVEIDNGLLGTNRHDIIVMRYEKNEETLLEKASLVVVKGVNSSEPVDPDITEGNILDGGDLVDDMPLYRVIIEGMNLVSIEPLFEVFDGDVGSILEELDNKVNKVTGKGLSTNDYTNEDKTKLGGIETGAEVNVQADWSQNDNTADDFIKHKPSIPSKTSDLQNDSNFVSDADYAHTDNNYTNADKEDVAKIDAIEHSLSTTSNVTGNPISISDSAHVNAEKLTVELEPIQDLHGYDNPWVGGAGKNKLPLTITSGTQSGVTLTVNDDGTATLNGTASEQVVFDIGQYTTSEAQTIIYSGSVGGSASTYSVNIAVNGQFNYADVYDGDSNPVNVGASATVKGVLVIRSGYTANNLTFYPMIRLATETDPTFEPYSNICPISGYDETSVVRSGKNLLPIFSGEKTNNEITVKSKNGYFIANGTAENQWDCSWNPNITLPAGRYICSLATNSILDVYMNTSNGFKSFTKTGTELVLDEPETITYIFIRFYPGTVYSNAEIKVMIRLATETDPTYEPYTANTYTLQFGDTVYGAEVDFVSGVATVKYGYAEYSSSDVTLHSDSISGVQYARCHKLQYSKTYGNYGRENLVCDKFVNGNGKPLADGIGLVRSDADAYYYFFGLQENTTLEEAQLLLNGVQLVYELATPYTIQLTPQQIKMLKGNNVLVADGDMNLTYQVDSVVGDVKEWAENEFLPKNSATVQHNYSTQEQVVGTWIDGSTLYEKTIIYTNTPNSDSWTTIASLTGVSIKKCEGVYRRTNNRLNMFNNSYISTGQTEQLIIGISANNINVHIGSMFIPDFIQIEITIQYTKTTD